MHQNFRIHSLNSTQKFITVYIIRITTQQPNVQFQNYKKNKLNAKQVEENNIVKETHKIVEKLQRKVHLYLNWFLSKISINFQLN